jgi:hypothetical protein
MVLLFEVGKQENMIYRDFALYTKTGTGKCFSRGDMYLRNKR